MNTKSIVVNGEHKAFIAECVNYKIKVNNEAESKEAQELSFELGCEWGGGIGKSQIKPKYNEYYLFIKDWLITYCDSSEVELNCVGCSLPELTLPQLRDLVAQIKNKQGLISGKEALIALANGESVQKKTNSWGGDCWLDISKKEPFNLDCFLSGLNRHGETIKFRFKPRTITINGIEVPAPFEPKNGEDFYYLDCTSDNYGGWAKTSWRNVESDSFKNNTVFGAWRTEEEIKQVVAALRQVFGGSHDN